jgi:hypothetical protein
LGDAWKEHGVVDHVGKACHEGVVVVVVVGVVIVESLVVVKAVEMIMPLVHELRGEPRVFLERHSDVVAHAAGAPNQEKA